MPTYEYECTHCGQNFEYFQGINDKHLENCPKCNKKIRRLISSGAGIIFKKKSPSNSEAAPATCPKIKEGCNACKPPG